MRLVRLVRLVRAVVRLTVAVVMRLRKVKLLTDLRMRTYQHGHLLLVLQNHPVPDLRDSVSAILVYRVEETHRRVQLA